MRGTKAKQLRKAAVELSLKEKVPTKWVYKRLKHLYINDPATRHRFNESQA